MWSARAERDAAGRSCPFVVTDPTNAEEGDVHTRMKRGRPRGLPAPSAQEHLDETVPVIPETTLAPQARDGQALTK